MPFWTVRPVATFDREYLRAYERGLGDWPLGSFHTEKAARRCQRDFRLFCHCLRQETAHEAHLACITLQHRSRRFYNHETKRWEVWVVLSESIMDVLSNATRG